MIDKKIIEDTLTQVLQDFKGKCRPTLKEIRSKLKGYSQEEKNNLLKEKTNQWEWEEYEYCTKKLPHTLDMLESFPKDYFALRKKEQYESIIFKYERRIVEGYNPQPKEVPPVDISKYRESEKKGLFDGNSKLEDELIKKQESNTNYSEKEESALKYYLGDNYKQLNSEIYNNKYWKELSEDLKKEYHNKNVQAKKYLDSALEKVDSIGEPIIAYHGDENWDKSLGIGDKYVVKGYNSCSFNKQVGELYSKAQVNDNLLNVLNTGVTVKYLLPPTIKGICGNSFGLSSHNIEHELLLGRNTEGTIIDIDWENREVLVLVE